ncbi:MAB_1171c family putative transporter [Saccharopolyspora sp. ID03-671]|uniref:MAB_1171c family putative transporter n=1 Tax=Saccharopolyspora sp. ID03-671 TaxID=3073066 RepID=UPI00324FB978
MSPVTVALLLALAWFTYRLLREPGDLALRAVVAWILLRVFGTLIGISDVFSESVSKLIYNLALNASWFCLMLFFLFSAVGHGAVRKAWGEAVVLTVTSVVMTVAMATVPEPVREAVSSQTGRLPAEMTVHGVAIFFLVGSCYFAYAASRTAYWAIQYAKESAPRARLGFRVAAVGFSCLATAAAIRAVFVVIRWSGGNIPARIETVVNLLVPLGILLFVLGVCSVGLSVRWTSARLWLRRRRQFHALRPLWQHLHTAFPSDELESSKRNHRDEIMPMRLHRRFWRRVVEIRDGMVQLSPQLADAGYDADRPAHEQVETFLTAVQRQVAGDRPSTKKAMLVAAPTGDSTNEVDGEVNELLALSRAL